MLASPDTIFDVLDSAFSSVGEMYFQRFMRNMLMSRDTGIGYWAEDRQPPESGTQYEKPLR
jgi:hypothetical protein